MRQVVLWIVFVEIGVCLILMFLISRLSRPWR